MPFVAAGFSPAEKPANVLANFLCHRTKQIRSALPRKTHRLVFYKRKEENHHKKRILLWVRFWL